MKLNNLSSLFEPVDSALQPYVDRARERFEVLQKREQLALIFLLVFLMVFFFYTLIWSPLNESIDKSKKTYQTELELLSWMKSQEANVLASREMTNKAPSNQNISLLSQVNNSASDFSLPLKRYEPAGEKKLRVWLESVSFDSLIRWINHLSTKKGLLISSISIDADQDRGGDAKSGLVNVKVVFEK